MRPTRWLHAAAGCAGVLLIASLVLAHGESAWLYRGGLTVVALAVAVAIAHLLASPGSYPALLLSLPPVVWLGRISYGLYLWHWPLFDALNAERTGLTGVALFGLRVAVTVAVATACYYLVELPIRRGVGLRLVPAAATAAATAVATAAAVVVVFAGTAPAPPRVAIFGDSVAHSLGLHLPPAGDDLAVTNQGFPGCGISRLPDMRLHDAPVAMTPGCDHWDEHWRMGVEEDDPDVAVILVGRLEVWDRNVNGRYVHIGDPDYDAYLTGELKLAISIVSAKGARVVLLTAPYSYPGERPDGSVYPEDSQERVDAWNDLLAREAATNPAHPTILDLNRFLSPDRVYTPSVGGVQLRYDGLGFLPDGVQQVIAPWLLPKLHHLATA